MKIKNILLISAALLLISACEDKKPEVSAADHLNLARLYFEQGSFRASIIEGKNALQIEPNNIEALTTMATVLLKLNAASSANDLVIKAASIDKNNQDIKLLLTKTYLAQNKLFSARNTFKNIDQTSVKNTTNYHSIQADLLLTSNEPASAKTWYLKAHESDKQNVEAIIGIAKSSLLLKQLDEVNKYTKLAIETSPNDIDALLWQARIFMLNKKYIEAENILSKLMIELERYDTLTVNKFIAIDMLAKALVAQGKINESLTYSNYLAQSKPGQIQSSYKNALSLISQGGNLNEAEKAFQEVLEQAPKHKSSNLMMGLINYNQGDYTQAEDYLSKFSNDENTPLRSKKLLILTKIKLNKPEEAIELITQFQKENKKDADLYALLGYAHLIKKETEKSISSLKQSIKLSNNNAIYHTQLAKAYLVNKDTKLAIETAKKALKIKPNSDQAKQILVSSYIYNKEPSRAKAFTNEWLKESPKNIMALMISAEIAQHEKDFKKARTQHLKVLALDPYNMLSNMSIVQLDLQDNNHDKALERLGFIINKYPENVPALNTLYKLSTGSQTTTKAIEIIDSVNNKHPFAINSRLTLAQIYLSKNNSEKALIIINDITKLDNKNIKAYFLKAKALVDQNKLSEAKDTYKLLTSIAPKNPASYIELGRIYIKEKEFTIATDYAEKALKLQNNFTPAHLVLFTVGMQTNNKAMTMKAISNIKQIIPASYLPYELKADYYLKTKEYTLALDNLKEAWSKHQSAQLANKFMSTYMLTNQENIAFGAWDELAQQNKNNLNIQASYALGLYKAKHFSKATSVLESQLKLFPNNVVLLNNLANIYLDTKDIRALAVAEKALSLHPNNPAIQDTVGWIYAVQEKDFNKAIPLLTKAYQTSADKDIKQHLISALTQSGKLSEANLLKSQ